ncbi:MAG: carboxypeptidase regulatory-like domain-containing protein [Chloroflexi bacterium]|nr:carboxypeptidase regulatory-like domain-containing protein [Chloroflexota bacterium]
MRRRVLAASALIWLSTACSTLALSPREPLPTATPVRQPITVRGSVSWLFSGAAQRQPLQVTEVRVVRGRDEHQVAFTATDENGRFEIGNLAPESYVVRVSRRTEDFEYTWLVPIAGSPGEVKNVELNETNGRVLPLRR